MIEAHLLHRLCEAVAKNADANGGIDGIHALAKHLGLDVEDTATLFRVASGEGVFPPVIQLQAPGYVSPGWIPNSPTYPWSIS